MPERMAIFALLPFIALVALAVSGCSSVKTQVDNGAVPGHSFSFLNTGPRTVPSYAEDRKEAHEMIQQAIISNLAAKGIKYAPQGGEITVAYLVIVGNNVSTTSLNAYFGYSGDAAALVERVHNEQSANKNREYFESGTLVIDLLNSSASKLFQRRSVQAEVLRNLPLEQRTARVQSLVDAALNNVPLAK
jgi:hypothetical protein